MTESRMRILVPLDGSPEAENILPALASLLRAQNARITLFGVAPTEDSLRFLEVYLDRLRKSLLLENVPSEILAEWGDPAEEILRAGKAARFDLIAMATHGRSGLHRELVGSVAESVLRKSEIPVLAFRPGSRLGDWKRIVVGLDGSAAAEAVLTDATELARAMGATLHLVQAKSLRPLLRLQPGKPFPVPEEDPKPYLEALAGAVTLNGVPAIAEAREGEAADEIVAVARETGAGLICLTTHGRTGLARHLLGSVAESVLRTAPCPVLLRRVASIPAGAGSGRA